MVKDFSLHDENFFGARVKSLRLALRLKAKDFAEAIGISPVHLSNVENGKRGNVEGFGPAIMEKIEELGGSSRWLRHGDGAMLKGTPPPDGIRLELDDLKAQFARMTAPLAGTNIGGSVRVPLLRGLLAAGVGAVGNDQVEEWISVPLHYIGITEKDALNIVAVRVLGKSMEPLIQEHEVVFIDRRVRDVRQGTSRSVWAVRVDNDVVLKHARIDEATRMLVLTSANPQIERDKGPRLIQLDKAADNPIIGKMRGGIRGWE